MTEEMTETLTYFFEAYLHQDWREDYPYSLDAVAVFARDETSDAKEQLQLAFHALQVSGLLTQDTFYKFGGSFKPETEGMTANEWLLRASKVLSA